MSLYLVAYTLSFKNKWDCKICNPTLVNRFIAMFMVKLRPYSLIWITRLLSCCWDVFYSNPGGSDGKASACNAGDLGSIPGSGRSPGEGNGNPLQYSCLQNSMDGGAWWATVHGVTRSWTRLSDFMHEQLSTAQHIRYLQKTHFRSRDTCRLKARWVE